MDACQHCPRYVSSQFHAIVFIDDHRVRAQLDVKLSKGIDCNFHQYGWIMNNYLYLGDCLDVLQDYVKDETVDLIYIDPPFNSKRNYNVFFDDKEIHSQQSALGCWTFQCLGWTAVNRLLRILSAIYSMLIKSLNFALSDFYSKD